MKIMGTRDAPPPSSRCSSRPLIPGICTSSTKQEGASENELFKNSWAEAKVSTFRPTERNKLRRLSRIEDSSSTTQTTGLFSFMIILLAGRKSLANKPKLFDSHIFQSCINCL